MEALWGLSVRDKPLTVLLWIHSNVEKGERNTVRFAVLTRGNIFNNSQKQELRSYLHEEMDIVTSQEMLLTCLRDLTAHSSKVSAASSLPCRRYRAPRFLRVVFTVGLYIIGNLRNNLF